MKRTIALILLMALAGSSDQTSRDKPASSHVLMVVIAGLRHEDFSKRDRIGLKIPTLRALLSRGAGAVSVDGVYPSTGLPSAASIATGVLPADHGITSDNVDPAGITTDTLWDAAKRIGLTAASLGFPLTASADLDFRLPDKPDAIAPDTVVPGKSGALRQALSSFGGIESISAEIELDDLRSRAMLRLADRGLPNLVLIHYGSFEAAQRKFGIQSKQARAILEAIDSELGSIIDTIERGSQAGQATFLVASDHGAMAVESVFKPNVLLGREGWLKVDNHGRITSWRAMASCFGGSAAIEVRDPKDIPEIIRIFEEYHKKEDSPVWRVLKAREISQLGADSRAAIYLDCAPGYAMSPAATGSSTGSADVRAASGYLPSRSEMRSILLLAGRGIRPGTKIEYARLIDIAPTVSRLMGLEMKPARGRVLTEVIAK